MSERGVSPARMRAVGLVSVILMAFGVVLGAAAPASAASSEDEVVKFVMPDGTVEYIEVGERAGSAGSIGVMAGFSWEASYSWRILSREWQDSGGSTTVTVYPISNCGSYGYQYLYLARKIIGGYQAVGAGRVISCANQTVSVWSDLTSGTYIFMLSDPEGEGGPTHSTHGRVAY